MVNSKIENNDMITDAYLFPGHGQVYELEGGSGDVGSAFWEMFDRTLIGYKDLANTGKFQGHGAWVIVSE